MLKKKFVKAAAILLMAVMLIHPAGVLAHGHHEDEHHGEHEREYHCLNHQSCVISKGKSTSLCVYRCVNGEKRKVTKNITWSSDSKSVAKVSSSGKVTGLKKGSACITAKYDGKKYRCNVKVECPTVSKKTVTVKKGSTTKIFVKHTCRTVTYSTSKRGIVSVSKSKKDGVYTLKVKGVKKGRTVLTVKAGCHKVASCTITVK